MGKEENEVAIIPDNLAHYRDSVFSAIARLDGIALTVYADSRTKSDGLKLVDDNGGKPYRRRKSKNYYLGRFRVWQTGIIEAVSDSNIDFVVAWGEVHNVSVWVGLIWARLKGKPFFLWTHGLYGKEGAVLRWLRVVLMQLGNRTLLYGNAARQRAILAGVDPEKIYVVYNSLSYKEQREVFERIGLERKSVEREFHSKNELRVGYIGRLVNGKRVEMLISLVASMRCSSFPVYLTLIGDGEERVGLERLCGNLEIRERVDFLGAMYEENAIAEELYSWDLCIIPGAAGLSAVHALSYGTPVATHDVAEHQMPEAEIVVPGRNGFVFKRDNLENLKEKLIGWFEDNPDRASVRARCRESVESFYRPDFQAKVFHAAIKGEKPKAEWFAEVPEWFRPHTS